MLLDNKTKTEDNDFYKVIDFLRNCIENGKVIGRFQNSRSTTHVKIQSDPVPKFRSIIDASSKVFIIHPAAFGVGGK